MANTFDIPGLGAPVAVAEQDPNGELHIHAVPSDAGKVQRGDSLYTLRQIQKANLSHFSVDAIHVQINFTQSDVLTIVEASFSDPLQRQAVVKLVKGAFNKRHDHIDNISGNGRGESATITELTKPGE